MTAQQLANDFKTAIYTYRLANGNTFKSDSIFEKGELVAGSQVVELISTTEPNNQ